MNTFHLATNQRTYLTSTQNDYYCLYQISMLLICLNDSDHEFFIFLIVLLFNIAFITDRILKYTSISFITFQSHGKINYQSIDAY